MTDINTKLEDIKFKPNKDQEVLFQYHALCPLDGRYAAVGGKLSPYFSEFALVKNRVKVEVMWLKFLLEKAVDIHSEVLDKFREEHKNNHNSLDSSVTDSIYNIFENFDDEAMLKVKEIEKVTNHDVKAVELYVADKLKELGYGELVSYVHIGLTSEDINNTSYARMLKDGVHDVWVPAAKSLISSVSKIATENASVPMLAHTHGQPATPTTVGKEFAVYTQRLSKILDNIKDFRSYAKFNGATGNYAAISVAFPNNDWEEMSKQFILYYLGLQFNPVTTQIENHDYMCKLFHQVNEFNNVLSDLDLDMWLYISKGYFKQIPVKNEVGSSTMPHKVNPIRFENSESNIEISNALLTALANKLPRSRWQRDLSDSSTQRNIGMALGYSLQAIEQTTTGLAKCVVDEKKINSELENSWQVLAEAIQTVLRVYGIPDAYNQLKELTRGKEIGQEDIYKFITGLPISDTDKYNLLNMTPSSYTGYAEKIATKYSEKNED